MAQINTLITSVTGNRSESTIKPGSLTPDTETISPRSFGDTISDFIKTVNNDQLAAEKDASDIVHGKSENIHEAMATLEEARLSFQLMLEVRNRLLEGYKEIERMQV